MYSRADSGALRGWHLGALWVSDVRAGKVFRIDLDGKVTIVADVPSRPFGLGFSPTGDLLVASMTQRLILKFGGHSSRRPKRPPSSSHMGGDSPRMPSFGSGKSRLRDRGSRPFVRFPRSRSRQACPCICRGSSKPLSLIMMYFQSVTIFHGYIHNDHILV